MDISSKIKRKAFEIGFSKIGIAKAQFYKEDEFNINRWIENGYHASMGWIERRKEERSNIKKYYKDSKSIQEGISIIISKIKKILHDNEVNEFLSIGEKFDPELHEALLSEPGKENNVILKEFEKGYKYKDKIIRHSKVVVSSKS